MAYKFKFRGGVMRTSEYSNEKFLLFFLVGGKEVPLYKMKENSLVWQERESDPYKYSTHHEVCKLFVCQQGFGMPKRYYSFYLRMVERGQRVNIVPFSGDGLGYYFSAVAKFMKKSEVLNMLPADAESRIFIKRQVMLPVDTLRKMITIDKTEMRKGIRHIRVGGKSK